MTIRFLSVCSGIEAASVALEPLGFTPVLYSEIERFPRAVLKHRLGAYDIARETGRVPLWGDFTALRPRHLRHFNIPFPELLIGGTPCQSFSVAGLRRGLSDARGNLTLSFVKLAHALRNAGPLRWLIWENVPGVLNHAENPFGCFLGGIAGADAPLHSPQERGRWPSAGMVAGPWARAAWRVFDCRYFGLAQRRERVFVVAGFGDGADPAAILFERKGLPGDFAPRRKQGKDVAPTIAARTKGGGGLGTDCDLDGGLIAAFGGNNGSGALEVAAALNAKGGTGRSDFESETFVAHTLRAEGFDASEDGPGRGIPLVPVPSSLAFDCKASGRNGFGVGEIAPTLRAMGRSGSDQNAGGQIALASDCGVRRLTPRECSRLQGFPDDWAEIPWNRKTAELCPDGPQYKAYGNSFPVPVIRWIGRRILEANGGSH